MATEKDEKRWQAYILYAVWVLLVLTAFLGWELIWYAGMEEFGFSIRLIGSFMIDSSIGFFGLLIGLAFPISLYESTKEEIEKKKLNQKAEAFKQNERDY